MWFRRGLVSRSVDVGLFKDTAAYSEDPLELHPRAAVYRLN
jgi:hypothetical protein